MSVKKHSGDLLRLVCLCSAGVKAVDTGVLIKMSLTPGSDQTKEVEIVGHRLKVIGIDPETGQIEMEAIGLPGESERAARFIFDTNDKEVLSALGCLGWYPPLTEEETCPPAELGYSKTREVKDELKPIDVV